MRMCRRMGILLCVLACALGGACTTEKPQTADREDVEVSGTIYSFARITDHYADGGHEARRACVISVSTPEHLKGRIMTIAFPEHETRNLSRGDTLSFVTTRESSEMQGSGYLYSEGLKNLVVRRTAEESHPELKSEPVKAAPAKNAPLRKTP